MFILITKNKYIISLITFINYTVINYIIEKNPEMTYDQVDGLISYYIENEIIPNLP